MRMRIFALATGILAAAWGAAADMTVVQKIGSTLKSGQASEMIMTMRIKGSKARIDFKSAPSTLIDLQAGKFFLVDHASKQATVMPLGQLKAVMDTAAKFMAGTNRPDTGALQKTGNTKVINGFNCQEYAQASAGSCVSRASYWIAGDVDVAELEPFREFAMNSAKVMGAESLGNIKGMLIACQADTTLQGAASQSTLEVQSIGRGPIDDEAFAVPADYRTTELAFLAPPAESSATTGK